MDWFQNPASSRNCQISRFALTKDPFFALRGSFLCFALSNGRISLKNYAHWKHFSKCVDFVPILTHFEFFFFKVRKFFKVRCHCGLSIVHKENTCISQIGKKYKKKIVKNLWLSRISFNHYVNKNSGQNWTRDLRFTSLSW